MCEKYAVSGGFSFGKFVLFIFILAVLGVVFYFIYIKLIKNQETTSEGINEPLEI